MRSLFGVDTTKNRIQFGTDFASLEARVQGHFIMPYNGQDLAKSLIAEKPNDCFDIDTEILTDTGWISYKEISFNSLLAQWCKETNTISYTNPTDIIIRKSEEKMISILGDRIDLLVTPNHRLVVFNEDIDQYVDILAKDLKEYTLLNPNCFIPASANNVCDDQLDYVINYYLNEVHYEFDDIVEKDFGYVVSTYDKNLIDEVQEELLINNCISLIINKNKNDVPYYKTLIPKNPTNLKGNYLKHTIITEKEYSDDVWCVSVPTTYIVVRRNNKVSIVGNCHTLLANKLGITRDIAKSVGYACLPVNNTEVLTRQGWKYYADLTLGDTVLTYDTEANCITEDSILKLHYFEDKEVLNLSNTRDSFEATADHRWYGLRRTGHGRKNPKYNVEGFFTTDEISTDHKILMSSTYPKQESNMTVPEARFLGWLLGDGYYRWSGKKRNKIQGLVVSLSQSINKFVNILENDLESVGYKYSINTKKVPNSNHINNYYISNKEVKRFFIRLGIYGINKHDVDWIPIILNMSEDCRNNLVETFYLSDGYGTNNFTQNYGKIHEAISLAIYLQGNRISITNKDANCSVIVKHSSAYITGQKLKKTSVGVRPTFCLTTNNSTFIIRQNKKFISITGNCMYGAQANKLALMLRIPLKEAKRIYDGYWDSVKPLQDLRSKVEQFWDSTGKQYIIGIDKRKLSVRSKHSLVNLLFQSTGALLVKYSTLYTCKRLLELNLLGDPFVDSDDSQKIFLMIVYHK